jgi:ATP-binding cassette subfamily B protein
MTGPEAQALMSSHIFSRRWDRPTVRDRVGMLATFSLFSGIRKRRLHALARQATFAEFAPGETVLAKGDRGDSLYIILSGAAKALGKPAARALRSGDYFGELALLAGAQRTATIVATRELHVMRVPGQPFLRLARDQPSISQTMLRNLTAQLRGLETQRARP